MKIIYLLQFVITFLLATSLSAQPEDNTWLFGHNGVLDFRTGEPEFVEGYSFNYLEGPVAISDAGGNLLFSSDGVSVYDRMGAIMPNGNGLLGNNGSSFQGAAICKKPGAYRQYYLFTLGSFENDPEGYLRVHTVDMSLNEGMGDVIEGAKNIILDSLLSEKMTITADRQCGYWLVTFGVQDDSYRSYHITEAGISAPVISYSPVSGLDTTYFRFLGQVKISPDGKRIANGRADMDILELGRFNAATGVVDSLIALDNESGAIIGCEFSADSKMLYAVNSILNQYDISGFPSKDAIEATKYSWGYKPLGSSVRRAGNGKIYIPMTKILLGEAGFKHIATINEPDEVGEGCLYEESVITLPSDALLYGNLGTSIIVNETYSAANVSDFLICAGGADTLLLYAPPGYSVYEWSTGRADIALSVTDTGTYWVRYGNGCHLSVDTIHVAAEDCISSLEDNLARGGSLLIYPNPVKDGLLYIKRSQASVATVRIFDITGRPVLEQVIHKGLEPLAVGKLSPGFYYVAVGMASWKKFIRL